LTPFFVIFINYYSPSPSANRGLIVVQIGIIGTGYVGLVTGACFAEFGVKSICVDRDSDRIRTLEAGQIPFYEPGLAELVQKNMAEDRLRFTTDVQSAIESSQAIFIAVGTPPRGDGSADLSYVEEVARTIADHLNGYKVVVTKSTVPVGTGQRIREIIRSKVGPDRDFDIASNPEFLREGSAIEDFMRPNRVVIGAETERAKSLLQDLYRPLFLIETPFILTDIPTAELIKYASNAFLATKVSFINEVANLCETLGADVHQVAKGMGLDRRIGPKFLHPGPGYGGSCFPKDTQALARVARSKGEEYALEIVEAAIRANSKQQARMVDKILRLLGPVNGKVLAFLGLAFKPNTDDIRDSVPVGMIRSLLKEGAGIRAYDPAAMESARKAVPEPMYCSDAYEAIDGADALILATEWNQFRNLDMERIKARLKSPVFIDLRNVYEPRRMRELGFRYVGVGRGYESPRT
jgi:UDPglucose 6-dehydrogenase